MLCPIMANHLGICIRKGFHIYVVQVGYNNDKNKITSLENIPVIQYFIDVFPESIPWLPPRRDIDFTIEVMPGETDVSKSPYRTSISELIEVKI